MDVMNQTTPSWYSEELGEAVNSSLFGNLSSDDTLFTCKTYHPTLSFITQVMYSLVCIVGLFGNSLVIYVVLRFSKMQTVMNTYIVNLAIADECFVIGIPFLIATMNLHMWPFGEIMCKIYMTTTSINQFTSSIFLTIMSADQYVAVCHPIPASKIRTPMISKVISISAWVVSGFLTFPVFLYSTTINNSCHIIWPQMESLNGQTAFTLYSFILGFLIPLFLKINFYVLIIRRVRTFDVKNGSKEKTTSHRKVTKLVLTVITMYIVCFLPYWITQIALIVNPPTQCHSHFTITIFLIVGILSYSNSAMNPILYAFLSNNFKKSFLKACTCVARQGVNTTLHVENRRHNPGGSERLRSTKGPTAIMCQGGAKDELGETGLFVRKTDHTITLTSRSKVTMTSHNKDSEVSSMAPSSELCNTFSSRDTVVSGVMESAI